MNSHKPAIDEIPAALIANSHGLAVKAAAKEMKTRLAVTDVVALPQLIGEFFEYKGGRITYVPVKHKDQAEKSLRIRNERLGAIQERNLPVFCLIGAQTFWFTRRLVREAKVSGVSANDYSSKMVRAMVREHNQHALRFYDALRAQGLKVYHIIGPPRFMPEEEKVWKLYDTYFVELMRELGVRVIDVRKQTCDRNGLLLKQYEPEAASDNTHAGIEWGKVVLDEIRARSGANNTAAV